jgi:hypothetical protein
MPKYKLVKGGALGVGIKADRKADKEAERRIYKRGDVLELTADEAKAMVASGQLERAPDATPVTEQGNVRAPKKPSAARE